MTILIVGPFYPFRGGIAHFGGCLYMELQKLGHQTFLVNFASQYPAVIFPGTSQYEKNSYFKDISSTRILTPYNPLTFHPALQEILSRNPDCVIFNYFIPFLAPSYLYLLNKLKKKNIKTILLSHNIIAHEKWFLSSYLVKKLLTSADKIITLSDAVYQDASQIIDKNNIIKGFHPLFDFYNKNRFSRSEAKDKLGLTNKKVILFFGYIKPYKGLETLLLCFPEVKKRFPDVCLLIAGEIYGNSNYYHQLIDKSPFKEDIILKNEYISDQNVELFFKASDLLAVPYRTATQSGVIQIAYSCNIGVVVTPVGGLPEMVMHQKTGIISNSVDKESFSKAICEFFSLDKELVARSIQEYKKQFSWQRLVEILTTSIR